MMKLDTVIAGGRVIDPSTGIDECTDIGILEGKISEIGDLSKREAASYFDATDTLVLPGMIDTHGHIYQHVTGKFGLDPDLVGVHSGVTTVIDQGGPSCMTIGGFRHYLYEKSKTRTLCFISAYLVGGLEGHLYPDLYGPCGVNPEHTIRVAKENLDIVKGVKAHAEIGGQSRWG
ncbi:MAG: amidohydrolase/deacetylase family metallohydrolase, partial [Opitutae bacterium]|nr:amidohydrolase/deacetylase family metallohydrolase [Opitutae bacterium]